MAVTAPRYPSATMKYLVIAGLIAIIAIGGALSGFAASRTVETSVEVEMEFWVDVRSSSAFVSTRQEGAEEWITHDFRVELNAFPGVPNLLYSEPVRLSLPVTVEVEVEEPALTPLPAATPQVPPGERPTGRATCCTVRGMRDTRTAQLAIWTEMRRVIAYARTNLGLTHEGRITINIAHQAPGLLVRYEDAFGERLDELPSECSFQRGTHLFFGPECRSNAAVIAREWFRYAVQTPYLSTRWVGVGTLDYYWSLYRTGRAPSLREDRYRSAVFHQPVTAFREGRADEGLMAAAALYAVESYGTFEDWLAFYEDVREGAAAHTAFEEAFGVELLRFYSDFERWAERQQTIMLATAYKSCAEAGRYLRPRSPAEGGGFADYHVPLEWDDDRDGYVCEEYSRFHREEELSCLVVGELTTEAGDQ